VTQYQLQHQSDQPMAGCQSRSGRPSGHLQSYQDGRNAQMGYGPPPSGVAVVNASFSKEFSSNRACIYGAGILLIEVRSVCRLVVADGQFTLLLSYSLLPLDIVQSLSTELAKLSCRLEWRR
jgi:hypothetical protein